MVRNIEKDVLFRIANTIMANHQFIISNGLFGGKTTLCLFLFIFARRFNIKYYEELANYLLDKIITNIKNSQSLDFKTGITGIAWGINYLIINKYVEGTSNEVLEEIDIYINEKINKELIETNQEEEGYVPPYKYLHDRYNYIQKGTDETIICNEIQTLGLNCWLSFINNKKITTNISYNDIQKYIKEMIEDIDPSSDLTMKGLIGIGLGLLKRFLISNKKNEI